MSRSQLPRRKEGRARRLAKMASEKRQGAWVKKFGPCPTLVKLACPRGMGQFDNH